jgi:hypothetical protein
MYNEEFVMSRGTSAATAPAAPAATAATNNAAVAADVARRFDDDSDRRGRPGGATGDARPEDLARQPLYERHARDGQRCYAYAEDDRERYSNRERHEYGHAASQWRADSELTQGRRRDGHWAHMPDGLFSWRGEKSFPDTAARSDAHSEHSRRYEQPLHAASGHNRHSPPRAQPHAGEGPRLIGDAGAAWRAPPRKSFIGQKRDRDPGCNRDGKWVWRSELERSHGRAQEHHGERRRPDILSEGRVDHGIQTSGAQPCRDEATAARCDPLRHDEQRMHGAGGVERRDSHADHRAPPLAPTGAAPPFALRVPTYIAAAGAARSPAPLELNRQLNQRLTQAKNARELLRLHAEYGGSFNVVNLATCWSRLGRVGCREGFARQLEALREQTLATLGEWGARALSNLAHALGKLEACGDAWSSLWAAVARASLQRLSEFKPQELSNMAWAYATAGHAPALLDAISAEAAPRVREFNEQDLANTAWAYATAGHAAPVLFDAIAVEAVRRVHEFTPQGLANTLWAYSTTGHSAPALLDAIAVEAVRRVRKFNAQGLANTAWAYATAGYTAPAILDAISAEAAPRVCEFKSQELSNLAWAYATAGHAAPTLLDAIAAEAAQRVREFKPQGLANTAWAYATAGHAAPALLGAIAAEAAQRVREFNPQNLAQIVLAYATAGHAAPTLLDAIAAEAAPRVREFNPQDLANTAWAYATAGHTAPALLDAIAAEAAQRVREFNPQNLAQIVWAYATTGHAAPTLLDAIAAEAAPRVREFNPQNLANTSWAYATAGHAAPALLDAIAAEAVRRVPEFNAQDLTNTAWAYAVANHPTDGSGLFGEQFARSCEEVAAELTHKNLSQLHQWALWHAGERGRSDCLPSDALLERCRAACCSNVGRPSRMQRDVGVALASLGLQPEEEVVLHEGYSLDFVVEWCGDRVGVEVDGPSHFKGREPNSATLLKRRQLRCLGWRLVSVSYWEWDEVVASSQRANEYLESLLEAARAPPG